MRIREFASDQGRSGGNYLKALASAWYNGTFNTGDLHKGIKSQEDVERILERGIHCGDGKVRKYSIGYNAAFDGVEIQSDDHYEHSDYDDAGNDIDERTGQPWGPYDVVEFHDRELDESAEQGVAEGEVVAFPKKHRGDISDMHDCPKCGGDLQGGKYQGHKVQVCMPCKQVYLPPNSGIDQKGNKIKEQGVAEGSESLEAWETRMKKLGYKITKDNKTGTYHAWQGTTHKGSHRTQGVAEEWSQKYKSSINCSHPKGFSQKAHCAGKKKHNESIEMEMVCEDCGMCQSHGNLSEIKKGAKDSNGFTRCWPGKHAEGTKQGKNGGPVRNCVPNEDIEEDASFGQSPIEETYHGNEFDECYGDMWFNEDEILDEADYHGRKVTLGKPMQGDVKKFKVYVKDPSTGNIKKVNFGDPDMRIKKSNPARRRSFRARHNCDNPGPRTKARYWSCRKW